MRLCIVGAGSIGGFVGARRARPGAQVTLVARGENPRALGAGGLHLVELPAACHGDTIVVPMQNGIPWRYFQRFPGPPRGRAIESVDAGGTIA